MNKQTNIFESVFIQSMESFAPTIYLALAYFEKQNTIISSKNANDKILEGIFLQFPRNIPQYKEMIKNLYLLSESNSESILHYLSKITKKILNDARDTLLVFYKEFHQVLTQIIDNIFYCSTFSHCSFYQI